MAVAYENETINDFFAAEDNMNIPICIEQLEQFLTNEDVASLSLTDSTHNSVASTPVIETRNVHPARNTPATSSAANSTVLPSLNRNGFDNPAFVTEVRNNFPEISPRLPDSPPDSGSEPYSPQGRDDVGIRGPNGGYRVQPPLNDTLLAANHGLMPHGANLLHPPSYPMGIPIRSPQQQQQGSIMSVSGGVPQNLPMQLPSSLAMNSHISLPQFAPTSSSTDPVSSNGFESSISSCTGHSNKKRKHSITPDNTLNQAMLNNLGLNIKQEQVDSETCHSGGVGRPSFTPPGEQVPIAGEYFEQPSGDGMAYTNTVYQSLKWQSYEQHKWHALYDRHGKELPAPTFRVEADKGFNFAVPDDAFVCQKKNHFQVTTHVGVAGQPFFVTSDKTTTVPISSFQLHLRGIKVEAINSNIRVEQSQADRSKKEFQPIRVDLRPNEITKATVGRLHFSETTSNNMRKKGKPNPDQRYFMLVVGIHAHTGKGIFTIASQVSERIIVRASNPGQFENDIDVAWQRGQIQDSVFHTGNVGIKTDNAEEALTVHGNIQVTGHIMQPSDRRAKEAFEELDPKEQLKNIEKVRIMQYKYKQAFAKYSGLPECDQQVPEIGIIAQELQEIIPDAVYTSGDVELTDGEIIDGFLVVNKDRVYMESIGAVKELCRLNTKLETRINEIEKVNRKLAKLKRLDSLKSTSSGSLSRTGSSRSQVSVCTSARRSKGRHRKPPATWPQEGMCLSPQAMQRIMVLLVFIMLFCVVMMAILVFMDPTPSKAQTQSPGSSENPGFLDATSIGHSNASSSTPAPLWTTLSTPSSCGYDPCIIRCCNRPTEPPSSTYRTSSRSYNDPVQSTSPGAGTRTKTTTMPTAHHHQPASLSSSSGTPTELDRKEEHTGSNNDPVPLDQDKFNVSSMEHATTEVNDSDIDHSMPEASSARRKKRDTNKVTGSFNVTQITTNVIKEGTPVDDDLHCKKQCGANGNYIYEIPVGIYYPNIFGNLEIHTSLSTKAKLCKDSFVNIPCNVQDHTEKTNSEKEGTVHSWNLEVGIYVNYTYTIRITTTNAGCNAPDGDMGIDFDQYTFIFYRNIIECPST